MVLTMEAARPLFGVATLMILAWLGGPRRPRRDWKSIGLALGLQCGLAALVLRTAWGVSLFSWFGGLFAKVVVSYEAGISFILGKDLGMNKGVLALSILPMVIFVSALSSLLFHYRVLPMVVGVFSWLFRKTVGMTGPEALCAAGNIFLGLAEAPTLIAPYLRSLSRAQLFMVMTVGMATVSGSLMAVYATFIQGLFGGGEKGLAMASAHLLNASVISAPAAFLIARLMQPESADGVTEGLGVPRSDESRGGRKGEPPTPSPDIQQTMTTQGFFDALAQGTVTGLRLTAHITAMLLVMVALLHLGNSILGSFFEGMTIERILGALFRPLAWALGCPWEDCHKAGTLLGLKVGVNDFVAYLEMGSMTFTSARTTLILTYALCGFANFGSIGIAIASLSALCPERRAEIAGLGLRSMLAGFYASCLTGCMAAVVG